MALYAVVRCKVLVEGSVQTSFARELMMGFGLLSVVVAAFLLALTALFLFAALRALGARTWRGLA